MPQGLQPTNVPQAEQDSNIVAQRNAAGSGSAECIPVVSPASDDHPVAAAAAPPGIVRDIFEFSVELSPVPARNIARQMSRRRTASQTVKGPPSASHRQTPTGRRL